MSTETELRDWRGGSTNAERLCAGVLRISGYTNIDPQAPLGGPDGKKDILAKRDGVQFVAAVFFPPTPQSFSAIEKKFIEDRAGIDRHGAGGFAFFVNQPLTLGEREALQQLGAPTDDLFHLERLRLALDSPQGYGLRLEFLRRKMTLEEQVSFFSTLGEELTRRLLDAQRVESKIDTIIERTTLIDQKLGITQVPSSFETPDVIGPADLTMSDLTIATVQLLHRALMDSTPMPASIRGSLRAVRLWVGDPNEPIYEPPPPEDVPSQLSELLVWWRDAFSITRKAGLPAAIPVLARFHYGIVSIHPFVDGNGRLARFVTDQAARELIGRGVSKELTEDRSLYFAALKAGNSGDLSALESLIRAALT